jgi:hypothetical protein
MFWLEEAPVRRARIEVVNAPLITKRPEEQSRRASGDRRTQRSLTAACGHGCAKTFTSGTAGVKVEQPQLAVTGRAMESPL